MYTDRNGLKWFKGNLHMHTTDSDGRMSPEDVMRLYKDNGYDFIALTDHWHVNKPCTFEGMTVLRGCEYDDEQRPRDGFYHIVGIGMDHDPGLLEGTGLRVWDIVKAIKEAGGLVDLAHPAWSLDSPEQIIAIKDADFTEIYNSVSGMPNNCRPYSGAVLDLVAARGVYLPLAGVDDAHWYKEGFDRCRTFTYVQAESGAPDDLLAAMRAGKMYASQDPTMDVRREGDEIVIDCSPVCEIVWFNDRPWTPHRSVVGENLTGARYRIHERDTFVRVEIKDAEGRYAWSGFLPVQNA